MNRVQRIPQTFRHAASHRQEGSKGHPALGKVVIEVMEPNSIHNQTDTLILDTVVQQCDDLMQALCLFVTTSETKRKIFH